MSVYVLFIIITLTAGFAVMAINTIYCNLRRMNVAIESNKKVVKFYDLATSPYYEGDEEGQEALKDLLTYIHNKNIGKKCYLSKRARDRYIPVTTRSTVWLSLLSLLEVAKTMGILLLLFGVLFVALIVAGTPL